MNYTRKIALLATVAILLGGGALCALVYGISLKKESIDTNATAWLAAEERREQLDSLLALVERTAEERATLASYMLTNESVIDFLSDIEHMARARNLALETRSLTVEPIAKNETFESLALVVDVTGNLDEVSSMLALIEAMPLQVSVSGVTLTRVGDTLEGIPQWRGSFDVRATKYK